MIMIICIIIIIIICTNTFEKFEIVGYNNTIVPDYKINSVYDIESAALTNLFTNLNKQNPNYRIEYLNDDPTFTVVNSNLTFPFTSVFKTMIVEYLKNSIPEYNKDKVYILGDLNNMYYKDLGNDRIFIFNFNLVNPVNFFTRNIKIRIKVNNIKLLLNPNGSYLPINDNVKKNIELDYITLDKNVYPDFTFKSIDINDYFIINNKYHLLDPFATSGKEFIITDIMKTNFQSVLNDKKKLSSIN